MNAITENVEIVETEIPTATVRVEDLPVVHERIEKANRRLAKAGIVERFELTVGEQTLVENVDPVTELVIDRYFEVEVSLVAPSIGYNGWRFIATLSFEQGGTVVRTVPGEECSYRPADQVCDQCHTARERNETFVVRHVETGEVKQLGRNCLALFFGIKPSLWIYDINLGNVSEGGSRGIQVEAVRTIVAAALAVSNGGPGYLSKAAAEYNGVATSSATAACLYEIVQGRGEYARERAAQLATWRAEQRRYLDEATTVDAVITAAQAIEGDSDYAGNIRVLAASEWVGVKNLGFVASFVAVYNRALRVQAERAAKAARVQGWIGAVGDKKVETTGTVIAKRFIEGDYGTTTLIEWLTTDGLTCKWFSSNAVEATEGDTITVTGTIKKHDLYQGLKATVFTRCKLAAAVAA